MRVKSQFKILEVTEKQAFEIMDELQDEKWLMDMCLTQRIIGLTLVTTTLICFLFLLAASLLGWYGLKRHCRLTCLIVLNIVWAVLFDVAMVIDLMGTNGHCMFKPNTFGKWYIIMNMVDSVVYVLIAYWVASLYFRRSILFAYVFRM